MASKAKEPLELIPFDGHDVEGFVFAGWKPKMVALRRGKTVAVLLHPPQFYPWAGVSFDGHDRFKEPEGKKHTMGYVLRLRVNSKRTDIIGWPHSIEEATTTLNRKV